jgi:phenylalanine-4-hydroxylase
MTNPEFGEREHGTWRRLYAAQRSAVLHDIHPLFARGLETLEIGPEHIPDLDRVNEVLKPRTGYVGTYVDGLKTPDSFFPMLARGEFPVGNFIRDDRDLAYTPAPDVFHDLFGHLPYFADPAYADFSRKFGAMASNFLDQPAVMIQFDRLYWFTFEFALIRHAGRTKILGSGIASSHGESRFALSEEPLVHAFDVEKIRRQDFRIDVMQKTLFRLESLDQLYHCLDGAFP